MDINFLQDMVNLVANSPMLDKARKQNCQKIFYIFFIPKKEGIKVKDFVFFLLHLIY